MNVQGTTLAKLRRRIGMTQVELAAALGVGLRTLKRYEATICPHRIWLAAQLIAQQADAT